MLKRILHLAAVLLPLGPSWGAMRCSAQPPEAVPRQRGAATADTTRPAHFPHRIWAACDFEGQTPDYAWFGRPETGNVPRYAGNSTVLAALPGSGVVPAPSRRA